MEDWQNAPVVDDWREAPVVDNSQPEPAPALKSQQRAGQLRNISTIYNASPKDIFNAAVGLGETVVNTAGKLGGLSLSGFTGLTQAGRNAEAGDTSIDPGQSREDYESGRPTRQIGYTPPADAVDYVNQSAGQMFAPKTEMGQVSEDMLASGVETAGKVVKYPLSAVPFAIGGSGEQEKFLNMPMGDYLGESAQDAGASPFFATMAHLLPDAALSSVGFGGAKKAGQMVGRPVIPTTEKLKETAGKYYKLADDSGARISVDSFSDFRNNLYKRMEKEGIDADLTPESSTAIKRIMDEEIGEGLTLQRAEILRKKLKNAQDAMKPSDQRLATVAIRELDEFMMDLPDAAIIGAGGKDAIQYMKTARALWSRSRKTEILEELIEKAKINADAATGLSGIGHTLRVQFRQLARNKKRMKMFTAEEQRAIKMVASGSSVEKVFRYLGKFDPVNPWNLAGSGAVGGAIGMAVGGPAMAAAGAAVVPVVGRVGRAAANKLTEKYAKKATETTRAGGN